MTHNTRTWRPSRQLAAGVLIVALSREVAGQRAGSAALDQAGAPQTAQQLVDRAASGQWDHFSARVAVRRRLADASGRLIGPTADDSQEFVWERGRAATGWKTTMTLLRSQPRTARSRGGTLTLPEPATVARIEDAEDGSAPRLFTRDGVLLPGPTPAWRERLRLSNAGTSPAHESLAAHVMAPELGGIAGVRAPQGREWIDSLIMSAVGRSGRMRAVESRFGRRAGVVRGLGRYVRQVADEEPRAGTASAALTHEVLVDEQSAVPVEANVVRNGALVSHSLFSYERTAAGGVVRRGIRIERAVPSESRTGVGQGGSAPTARVVSEVLYSDIRLTQNGGR